MVLGFDTATPATVAGVLLPGGAIHEARDDPPPGSRGGHASRLLPLVAQVMGEAGIGWDEVGRLAVGVGPGGFTGLRIGVATGRALAQARELPVVAVSSLHALAAGAQAHSAPARTVLAAIDARRGEAFAAAWAGEERLIAPQALAPEALAAHSRALALTAAGPEPLLAVGDGAIRFREVLERAGAHVPADGSPLHRLSAAQVCRLGAGAPAADRDALVPAYSREPDAKPRLPTP